MATVRCPSCQVALKVQEEKLKGRLSARCPRCGASVPLAGAAASSGMGDSPAESSVIRVTCGSCQATLKAPASRAGTTSHCPRCKTQIQIGEAAAQATVAGARREQEESSSAATRRIHSSELGMTRAGAAAQPAGIDVEAFLRQSGSETIAPPRDPAPSASGKELADSLMKPQVAELNKIASEIRQAAQGFAPAASHPPAPVVPEQARGHAAETPASPAHSAPRPHHSPASEPARPARTARESAGRGLPFPITRGLLTGTLAGVAAGGCAVAAGRLGFAAWLAPVPVPLESLALPVEAIRISLPGLLGGIAGLIAAGAGSPRRGDHPLSLTRCGGAALLSGLACGLLTAATSGQGIQIWPVAHWMRDLLLVGLLTPAVNRILPGPRS